MALVILSRQKQLALTKNPKYTKERFDVDYKAIANADYQNVVAALDEVLLNDLKHYALVDEDQFEKQTLQKLGIQ